MFNYSIDLFRIFVQHLTEVKKIRINAQTQVRQYVVEKWLGEILKPLV